jgi:hypothetical protein
LLGISEDVKNVSFQGAIITKKVELQFNDKTKLCENAQHFLRQLE